MIYQLKYEDGQKMPSLKSRPTPATQSQGIIKPQKINNTEQDRDQTNTDKIRVTSKAQVWISH